MSACPSISTPLLPPSFLTLAIFFVNFSVFKRSGQGGPFANLAFAPPDPAFPLLLDLALSAEVRSSGGGGTNFLLREIEIKSCGRFPLSRAVNAV